MSAVDVGLSPTRPTSSDLPLLMPEIVNVQDC